MPHYKLMMDRSMLGACDLQGKEVVVEIARVEQGELAKARTSKKERKAVLSFKGKDKKFVVNATNGATIASLYGPFTEAWVGKRIALYPTTTKFGGAEVECIRVRPRAPTGNAPSGNLAAPPPVDVEVVERDPLSAPPAPDPDAQARAEFERDMAEGDDRA